MRPAPRCWRTWRIWSRAARLRPKGLPRSTAFIGWRGRSALRVELLFLFYRLRPLLRREVVDCVVDLLGQRYDARRVGTEIMAAVARGRADVDARTVGVRANADHHVVAKSQDRRAEYHLDAAFAPPRLRRTRIDGPQLAFGQDVHCGFERLRGGRRDDQRLDRRIG